MSKTEEFIKKANAVHGNIFDYSAVAYVNNATKITITCRYGHTFDQTPKNHLAGAGCAICSKRVKKTPAMFIEEAIQIHGNDKYDYSQVNTFKDVHTKVSIICKTCNNTFQVTPDKHINDKNGCPTCAGNIKRTTDKFIEIANQNHNNQYLYDKVVYINTDENVIITCKVHGDFLQRPRAHLEGSGCLQCKKANT